MSLTNGHLLISNFIRVHSDCTIRKAKRTAVEVKLKFIVRSGSNCSAFYFVRMAKCTVVKVKLTFIVHSGFNQSAFYSYRATGVGLSNNPLLCTCANR